MSLSLRRFVALPKIVQADHQPRRPRIKQHNHNCIGVLLHCRIRSSNAPSNMVLRSLQYGIDITQLCY